jgi:hypothetical protein
MGFSHPVSTTENATASAVINPPATHENARSTLPALPGSPAATCRGPDPLKGKLRSGSLC